MAALSNEEIERQLAQLTDWQREGETIVREFELTDFSAAIALVERIAQAAQAANHHPDLLVHGWNKLRVTLSTHSVGALTDADFALAGRIDALA